MPPSQFRTREQLDEILRARRGTLEETPYPILLLALAAHEKSGVLELRRNQLEKKIMFDAGSPVECRSNIATETLGRFLVSLGKLSEQNCHLALAESASRGVPLGEILTERKLLAPTDLYRMLQQNLGRKLLEPFSWKSGTYEISYDVPPIASALRVKVPQLIVTGIVKVETQETADEAVAGAKGKYVAVGSDPLFPIGEVRLNADQQKVADAAQRGAAFDEIRVDADDLHRIVYAFMLLGAVTITDAPVIFVNPFAIAIEEEPPTPPPAPPAPPPVAAEEVIAEYLSYRRKDAFDLLGVEETAGLIPIARAFLDMSDKYLPSKFEESIRDKAQDVFLAAARAYAELADPDRRDKLVKRREKLREQAALEAQKGAAALIDPEALCETGRTLAAAGKLREALSSFEMAAECDAQNGAYAAEAAWCRFQLKSTPPANALKLLKNAIRIDPNCAIAYLYAGQVQGVLGHRVEAEAYLNRAAMLMPKDVRVSEAFKRLR